MGCGKSTSASEPNTTKLKINAGTFVTQHKGGLPSDYEIVSSLGSGAFAEVKLSIYRPTNEKRAVKCIYKAGLHHQQLDSSVSLSEIRAFKLLDHPNIIRCFEIYEDIKFFYISIEYCGGGELFSKILELKRFNENDAALIMRQLLSAVAYCHDRDIIHRDLKPENILLEEADNSFIIKVSDFGSSRMIDKERRLSGCFGSAYYVAPEVLLGEYNEKCDVWSCGVIMYILLTGRPPYPGKDEHDILRMVRTKPLQITRSMVPNASSDALDLLQSMLEIDLGLRISAREAVNHSWFRNSKSNEQPIDLQNTMQSLQVFNASTKLKEAVHVYLATHVISRQDLQSLRDNFIALDANGDGKISRDELLQEYKKSLSISEANEAVEQVMKQVDFDESGDIDYSEFLKACMDHSKVMSIENLQNAFKLFDIDGSGDITVDEIKRILDEGNLQDDEIWQDIMKQVDANGDGVIDLSEFCNLMTRTNSC